MQEQPHSNKILKLATADDSRVLTIWQVENLSYCLVYRSRTRRYINNGVKIAGDSYCFYTDVGRGFQERFEITPHSENCGETRDASCTNWSVSSSINATRYEHSTEHVWHLQTRFSVDTLVDNRALFEKK